MIVVKLFTVVAPNTFNDYIHVVEPFNLVVPDTFKLLTVNVEGFVKLLIYVNNVVDVVSFVISFNIFFNPSSLMLIY